jgi:hypothetical protein
VVQHVRQAQQHMVLPEELKARLAQLPPLPFSLPAKAARWAQATALRCPPACLACLPTPLPAALHRRGPPRSSLSSSPAPRSSPSGKPGSSDMAQSGLQPGGSGLRDSATSLPPHSGAAAGPGARQQAQAASDDSRCNIGSAPGAALRCAGAFAWAGGGPVCCRHTATRSAACPSACCAAAAGVSERASHGAAPRASVGGASGPAIRLSLDGSQGWAAASKGRCLQLAPPACMHACTACRSAAAAWAPRAEPGPGQTSGPPARRRYRYSRPDSDSDSGAEEVQSRRRAAPAEGGGQRQQRQQPGRQAPGGAAAGAPPEQASARCCGAGAP